MVHETITDDEYQRRYDALYDHAREVQQELRPDGEMDDVFADLEEITARWTLQIETDGENAQQMRRSLAHELRRIADKLAEPAIDYACRQADRTIDRVEEHVAEHVGPLTEHGLTLSLYAGGGGFKWFISSSQRAIPCVGGPTAGDMLVRAKRVLPPKLAEVRKRAEIERRVKAELERETALAPA